MRDTSIRKKSNITNSPLRTVHTMVITFSILFTILKIQVCEKYVFIVLALFKKKFLHASYLTVTLFFNYYYRVINRKINNERK